MADDQWEFWIGQFAVHYVQIRAAHGAGEDLELHFAISGFRHWPITKGERLPGLFQNHCAHEFILAQCWRG
jgi:hypothetical protein